MDCTGEENRKRICCEYMIKPIGCIMLYGGREVVSDAGGKIISDKYYKFLCIHKNDGHHEFIQCGYPTAKHICELSNTKLPSEFNPFTNTHSTKDIDSNNQYKNTKPQNRGRKQLDIAIMLFITLKDSILKPDTAIFKIKERVEKNMYSELDFRDVKAVNTILTNFHTSISQIVVELKRHGTVKNYKMDILIKMIDDKKISPNCYR